MINGWGSCFCLIPHSYNHLHINVNNKPFTNQSVLTCHKHSAISIAPITSINRIATVYAEIFAV